VSFGMPTQIIIDADDSVLLSTLLKSGESINLEIKYHIMRNFSSSWIDNINL
jgi:hypothetical protein